MIDPREYRSALGRFATGITVVTMQQGDEVHGITVNAFMSVSLKPPLVLISIDQRANAHTTLHEVERYGVSVLADDQEQISNHFAGRPTDLAVPFVELAGVPLVEGALAHLACTIVERVDAGDHTLFIGEVDRLAYADGAPLLYFQGKYARVEELQLHE